MHWNWTSYNRLKANERRFLKQQKEAFKKIAETVIKQSTTKHLDLQNPKYNHLESVYKYVAKQFPNVNVRDVPVYIVQPDIMESVGWHNFGGCYLSGCHAIFMKDGRSEAKPEGDFQKLLAKHNIDLSIADVLVHELFHAISHKQGRCSRAHTHMEEEFVYTRTIDWFREKGMTNEEIGDKYLLPFVSEDVLRYTFADMLVSFTSETGISTAHFKSASDKDRHVFVDKHAAKIVPIVIRAARKRALDMIERHEQLNINPSSSDIRHSSTNISKRITLLDF